MSRILQPLDAEEGQQQEGYYEGGGNDDIHRSLGSAFLWGMQLSAFDQEIRGCLYLPSNTTSRSARSWCYAPCSNGSGEDLTFEPYVMKLGGRRVWRKGSVAWRCALQRRILWTVWGSGKGVGQSPEPIPCAPTGCRRRQGPAGWRAMPMTSPTAAAAC